MSCYAHNYSCPVGMNWHLVTTVPILCQNLLPVEDFPNLSYSLVATPSLYPLVCVCVCVCAMACAVWCALPIMYM